MTVHEALEHPWIKDDHTEYDKRIAGSKYMGVRTRIHQKYVSEQPLPPPLPSSRAEWSVTEFLHSFARAYK